MEKIIKAAVDRGASDLHIKAGDVFRARIDGKLVPLTKQRLTPEQTKAIALRFIPGEEDRARIDGILDFDCSWGAPGIGRFRVNILRQRSSFMIVMRVIPFEVPTLDTLRLPDVLQSIASAGRGLILVSGMTGSGKSSTMAAMIDYINRTAQKHIVTLENPIEFLHRDVNCSLTQREVGTDTESFRSGLRAALRQDPDVILIGEMRDPDTIDTAMKAVETGQLLISSLTAPDAPATVSRTVALFPPDEQEGVRVRLADALSAVVSQRLLRRKDGQGRVAALEVMMVTSAIRDRILDPRRSSELRECIAKGREQSGMQTFDQHLMALVQSDQVAYEAALASASDPADFERQMRAARPTPPPAQPPRQTPTQPPKQAPTEPPKQAPPPQPPRQAPVQPPKQAPTEPPKQAPPQPPKQAPAQPPRQAPAQSATQPATSPPRQPPAQSATPPAAPPPRQAPAQSPTQPVAAPAAAPKAPGVAGPKG